MAIPKINLISPKKNRDILGIEIDENYIKIARLSFKGIRREFSDLFIQPIRDLSEDGLVLLIKQAVGRFGILHPRVYLTVPLSLVITRNIEIPSQDPEEIREIVNLQASRHTPYARAEIIVDMLNLGLARERYTKILLVIVPKETVNKQILIIERSGLRLEKVIFPPEAMALIANKMMGKDADDGPYAVLHMDYAFTNFIVVEGAKILFVRGIHIGASQLVEERQVYLDRFQDELEKSVETYNTDEVGAPPKTILLSGAAAQVGDLADILVDTLKMRVKSASYIDYFHISEAAKKVAVSNKEVSFKNLLAPIAIYDRLRVDLTSEEKRLKIQLEKRVKEMMKLGVLTMLLLSLIFVNVTSRISFKKAYLKKITTQYLPIREGAKQLEQMLAKTELVKYYLVSRGNSLKALTQLYDTTPTDIRISEIKYDELSQKFSLKGTSIAMSSVFSFVSELEKAELFKNVKTKYVNSRNEGGRDVADFEINCLIDSGMSK